ncbi:DedA family protein [Bailinhaonella thermotolerans]|uniref:DedA family protein n=2 Tax=Bailinhaonella thermotolerans TaxID=1070861 RepID=A0A3A4B172_9ACTN|nr:DedA family protein [Bailinhaonella thermotolerans]
MESLGAPGVGLLVALENVFPPIPSEVVLPLAGFTASQGRLGLIPVIAWATAGSLVGALILYGLGRLVGHDRAERVLDRLPLVDVEDLDKAENWFRRYGGKAVFFGRLAPVVRSLISIPAGTERMPVTRFCLLTTLGSLLWNTTFVLLGYGLGTQWERVSRYADWFTWAVIAVIVLLLVRFVVSRLRRSRARRS